MSKRKIALVLVVAMLTLIMLPGMAAGAATPPAGWNNLQPIEIFGNRTWNEGWAGSSGGLEVTSSNLLPIDTSVTTPQGYPSLRVNNARRSSWWQALMTVNYWWMSANASQYFQNGALEFDIKGAAGGETFQLGFQDRVKERAAGETITQQAPISSFGVTLTTDWQHVKIPLKNIILSPDFNMSELYTMVLSNAAGNTGAMKFWIGNIFITSPDKEKNYPFIKVNQVGYVSDAEKYALVSGFDGVLPVGAGAAFQVKKVSDGSVAYSGTLSLRSDFDQYVSGERVLMADFTSFNTPGDYYITVTGINENSPSFKINDKNTLYNPLLIDSSKYFYYQRANMALTTQYAGAYDHPAWHTDDANCPLKSTLAIKQDVSQGWYDAGDFGKYTDPAALSLADLLWTYELFPGVFTDSQFNIPESGNGRVDILDEMKYELDFVLKMQEPVSGGFWSRVWPQNENNGTPRYIDDMRDTLTKLKPTSNTANAVGTLAQAAVVWKNIDVTYSNTLLAAAQKGWTYLEANPAVVPTPTGPYDEGTTNDANDRFYAACSLFRATGEAKYDTFVKAHYTEYTADFDDPQNGHGSGSLEMLGFF